MKRRTAWVLGALVGTTLGLYLPSVGPVGAQVEPPVTFTVPPDINATCSDNVTGALESFLNGLPAGSTVSLGGPQSCYQSNGVLRIADTSLHIEGGGATISAPKVGTANNSKGPHPIILFAKDTDTTLSDVHIYGALNADATNGGVAYENYIGIETVSSKNLTLSGIDVKNIQGDCVSVQFPTTSAPVSVEGNMLNRNVLIESSSVKQCGWVAFSIESVNGFRMTSSTIGKAVDSIDMEYNIYSSQIPPDAPNGQARFAAMDNILFDHDVFKNWGAAWFVTLNGQTKCQAHPTHACSEAGGVQERNVILSNNMLSSNRGGLIDVEGTNPEWTTEPYTNQGLTITNNISTGEARPLHGGAITTPHVGEAIKLQYVRDVTISGNTFPLYHGHPGYFENTLYIDAVQPKNIDGLFVTHNNFLGAISSVNGAKANTNFTQCQNTHGLAGAVDEPCNVAILAPA